MIDKSKCRLELQGKKLYVIPQFLDKSIAVKYLISKYNDDVVITAGDSSVDELFVKAGTLQILPAHSNLNIVSAIRTKNYGIEAGEEILSIILSSLIWDFKLEQNEIKGEDKYNIGTKAG